MTYDELKNGLKSLFSTLGAKTSDSNYGVALLDKTSGEPKGLMGMSALASVLGGQKTILSGGNLNDIKTPGTYWIASNSITNRPADTWGCLKVFQSMYGLYQEYYCESLQTAVYHRAYINSQSQWTDWIRLDNFGCSTLAELKAALAAV